MYAMYAIYWKQYIWTRKLGVCSNATVCHTLVCIWYKVFSLLWRMFNYHAVNSALEFFTETGRGRLVWFGMMFFTLKDT